LTGSPIGGKIVTDEEGPFKYTIVFGGVCCAIGTVFFVATRLSLGMKTPKI
jgi:hypothetical protein